MDLKVLAIGLGPNHAITPHTSRKVVSDKPQAGVAPGHRLKARLAQRKSAAPVPA